MSPQLQSNVKKKCITNIKNNMIYLILTSYIIIFIFINIFKTIFNKGVSINNHKFRSVPNVLKNNDFNSSNSSRDFC